MKSRVYIVAYVILVYFFVGLLNKACYIAAITFTNSVFFCVTLSWSIENSAFSA